MTQYTYGLHVDVDVGGSEPVPVVLRRLPLGSGRQQSELGSDGQ